MDTGDERRIAAERSFHDARFGAADDPRAALDKWYLAAAPAQRRQDEQVLSLARGAVVLEYGCADGALSLETLRLQEVARVVHGIDLSDAAVQKAVRRAQAAGAEAHFEAMNAEALQYPAGTFDVVFGRGILHHLDLGRAYAEIARVLKPGGAAVFLEPLGHNPIINWFRRRTPDMRTADEHPLLMSDVDRARAHFHVQAEFFGLATLGGVFLRGLPVGRAAMRAAEAVDGVLLRTPGIRWQAWMVLLTFRR